MKTRVVIGDYNKIKETFTEEEIKEKYGELIIKSQIGGKNGKGNYNSNNMCNNNNFKNNRR